jgi:hypothetical protein
MQAVLLLNYTTPPEPTKSKITSKKNHLCLYIFICISEILRSRGRTVPLKVSKIVIFVCILIKKKCVLVVVNLIKLSLSLMLPKFKHFIFIIIDTFITTDTTFTTKQTYIIKINIGPVTGLKCDPYIYIYIYSTLASDNNGSHCLCLDSSF